MPWGMASEAPSLAVIALPPLLPPPPVSTRHLETPRDGYLPVLTCVSSKIRAPSTCSQAEGRRFESGIPLENCGVLTASWGCILGRLVVVLRWRSHPRSHRRLVEAARRRDTTWRKRSLCNACHRRKVLRRS